MTENLNENENKIDIPPFSEEDIREIAENTALFTPLFYNGFLESEPQIYPFIEEGSQVIDIQNPPENSSETSKEDPIIKHFDNTRKNGIIKGIFKGVVPKNLSPQEWLSHYKQLFKEHVKHYPNKDLPQIQTYFVMFANALMFDLAKNTSSEIECYGRIKSQFSFLGKALYRSSAHSDKPIKDIFGLKFVLKSTEDTLPSNDPLMQQKAENTQKIIHFQELADTYLTDDMSFFKLKTSEYYSKFIELLESFENVLPIEATDYRAFIAERRKDVENKLSLITSIGLADTTITEAELQMGDDFKIFYDPKKNQISDFTAVLAKYKEANNDLINYSILCNQFNRVLNNTKILERFHSKFVKADNKSNSNGYQARFITLETPIGLLEIQLQTDNQLKEGMTGFNAHNKFKSIPPLPIIPLEEGYDWGAFYDECGFISPSSFTVVEDTSSPILTMKTTHDNLYQALKKVLQVAQDSPYYSTIDKYLKTAYQLLNNIIEQSPESKQPPEIVEYLNGEEFKRLIQKQQDRLSSDAPPKNPPPGGPSDGPDNPDR